MLIQCAVVDNGVVQQAAKASLERIAHYAGFAGLPAMLRYGLFICSCFNSLTCSRHRLPQFPDGLLCGLGVPSIAIVVHPLLVLSSNPFLFVISEQDA